MKLKSFYTDIFAGINDIDVEFDEGLNILLGPNEAGKSSIINALFVSLFIEPKLRYNYSDLRGTEFSNRFFPYPEGNYVNGKLTFSIGKDKYSIYKKWSNNDPDGYMVLPDNSRINKGSIKKKRQELLPYGKSTYENIVFTRQEEVKTFLKNITEEDELTELKGTVSNVLRKAVLELGDISIDKLGNKIEEELENLLKKWDLDNKRPTNPERGINNPYKVGTGEIYDTYIKKELLRREINDAEEKEKTYQSISEGLEDINNNLEEIKQEKEELEDIEDDIVKREDLARRKSEIIKSLENMDQVVEKWPKKENEINKLNKKLEELKSKIDKLEEEKETAKKFNKKKELEKKIKKIDKLNQEMKKLDGEMKKLGEISKEKVDKLDKYKQRIKQSEASLDGAKLKAKVNKASSSDISVVAGIEDERTVQIDEEISAEGYINIKTENIDIEVESAKIDYEEISKKYMEANEKYQSLLNELDVEDVSSARDKLQELRDLENYIKNKKHKVDEILNDKSYEELEKQYNEYKDIEETREIETIDEEIENKKDKKRKLETSIEINANKVKEWEEEYESIKNLKNNISELKEEKKGNKEELKGLAKLPERFDTTEKYRNNLKELRGKYDNLNDDYKLKQKEMFKAKGELPDNSTEDMKEELQELEYNFQRQIERAESLVKIKNVYKNKLSEIDDKSFEPLIDSFSNYINELTNGKYKIAKLDDKFQIELESENGRRLPADIQKLSFGTSDSTALALRFALFENMFEEEESFIILDDCLVNLDPTRRKRAIELIQEFSEKFQVIFSTCNPETANDLGGNIINIE